MELGRAQAVECMRFDIQPDEKAKLVHDLRNFLFLGFIGACQLVTFVALTGQLRMADNPAYRELPTDLLNPWKTWLWFGTSWNHWGGPYSIFWYWANVGLTLNGLLPYTPVLFIVNLVIQYRLGRSSSLGPFFSINSLFTLLAYPQNMIIVWLIFYGYRKKLGLILAPLFKLPVGGPLSVWMFLWTNPRSIREPDNWFVYAWIGILWIVGFFYFRHSKNLKVTGKVPSQPDYADPENIEGQSKPELERLESKDENQGKIA